MSATRPYDQYRDCIGRTADLSLCGKYRWSLSRDWPTKHRGPRRVACFVMLNPSTADASKDDPTIRRCISFARKWDSCCWRLVVRNLFPYRATNPKELLTADAPTGGRQGDIELELAKKSDIIVAAWGASVPLGREDEARHILNGAPLYCLGTTKKGKPRHPLYVRGDQELVPFEWS